MRTTLENLMVAMICAGWARDSSGDVESPTGAFAIVEIDGTEKAHQYSTEDSELDELLYSEKAKGFYFVREDSSGNVFVESDLTLGEAEQRFMETELDYVEWLDEAGELY